jgi:hypothetical protein
LAGFAAAQPESIPPAQIEPPDRPSRLRPGEYPAYLFSEHFPAPVTESNDEFQQKYLFGDWLGARSQLADEGIKPLVIFISDPFVNATGGRRQALANMTCSASTSSLTPKSSAAGMAANFGSALPTTQGRAFPRNTSVTTSLSSSRMWQTPTLG